MVRDLRMPFGGMKMSGMGKECQRESLEFYTESKNICVQYWVLIFMSRIFMSKIAMITSTCNVREKYKLICYISKLKAVISGICYICVSLCFSLTKKWIVSGNSLG